MTTDNIINEHINSFTKGMNMDSAPNMIQNDTYMYAENVRITADKDGTSGLLCNSNGVDLIYKMPLLDGEKIVHTDCIRYFGVVFTKNTLLDEESGGRDRIYVLDFRRDPSANIVLNKEDGSEYDKLSTNKKLDVNNFCTLILDSNASIKSPISSTLVYESDQNVKLYWADGYNSIRSIELNKGILGKYLNDSSIDMISINPTCTSEKAIISKITTGSLNSGIYSYTYLFTTSGGNNTVAAPLSDRFIVYPNADKYNDSSNDLNKTWAPALWLNTSDVTQNSSQCGLNVKIRITDETLNSFDNLRIVRAYKRDLDDVVNLIRFEDISLSSIDIDDDNYYTFSDNGSKTELTDEVSTIYDTYSSLQSSFSPKFLEQKDNILFAANFNEESDSYETMGTYDNGEYPGYDFRAFQFNRYGRINMANVGSKSSDYKLVDSVMKIDETNKNSESKVFRFVVDNNINDENKYKSNCVKMAHDCYTDRDGIDSSLYKISKPVELMNYNSTESKWEVDDEVSENFYGYGFDKPSVSEYNSLLDDNNNYDITKNRMFLGGSGSIISYEFVTADIAIDSNVNIKDGSTYTVGENVLGIKKPTFFGNVNSDGYPVLHGGYRALNEPFISDISRSILPVRVAKYESNNTYYDDLIDNSLLTGINAGGSYSNPYICSRYQSLKRNEIYRYAITFRVKGGKRVGTFWIADIKIPNSSVLPYFSVENNVNGDKATLYAHPIGIKFYIDVYSLKKYINDNASSGSIDSFEIIQAHRATPGTSGNKTIVCSGYIQSLFSNANTAATYDVLKYGGKNSYFSPTWFTSSVVDPNIFYPATGKFENGYRMESSINHPFCVKMVSDAASSANPTDCLIQNTNGVSYSEYYRNTEYKGLLTNASNRFMGFVSPDIEMFMLPYNATSGNQDGIIDKNNILKSFINISTSLKIVGETSIVSAVNNGNNSSMYESWKQKWNVSNSMSFLLFSHMRSKKTFSTSVDTDYMTFKAMATIPYNNNMSSDKQMYLSKSNSYYGNLELGYSDSKLLYSAEKSTGYVGESSEYNNYTSSLLSGGSEVIADEDKNANNGYIIAYYDTMAAMSDDDRELLFKHEAELAGKDENWIGFCRFVYENGKKDTNFNSSYGSQFRGFVSSYDIYSTFFNYANEYGTESFDTSTGEGGNVMCFLEKLANNGEYNKYAYEQIDYSTVPYFLKILMFRRYPLLNGSKEECSIDFSNSTLYNKIFSEADSTFSAKSKQYLIDNSVYFKFIKDNKYAPILNAPSWFSDYVKSFKNSSDESIYSIYLSEIDYQNDLRMRMLFLYQQIGTIYTDDQSTSLDRLKSLLLEENKNDGSAFAYLSIYQDYTNYESYINNSTYSTDQDLANFICNSLGLDSVRSVYGISADYDLYNSIKSNSELDASKFINPIGNVNYTFVSSELFATMSFFRSISLGECSLCNAAMYDEFKTSPFVASNDRSTTNGKYIGSNLISNNALINIIAIYLNKLCGSTYSWACYKFGSTSKNEWISANGGYSLISKNELLLINSQNNTSNSIIGRILSMANIDPSYLSSWMNVDFYNGTYTNTISGSIITLDNNIKSFLKSYAYSYDNQYGLQYDCSDELGSVNEDDYDKNNSSEFCIGGISTGCSDGLVGIANAAINTGAPETNPNMPQIGYTMQPLSGGHMSLSRYYYNSPELANETISNNSKVFNSIDGGVSNILFNVNDYSYAYTIKTNRGQFDSVDRYKSPYSNVDIISNTNENNNGVLDSSNLFVNTSIMTYSTHTAHAIYGYPFGLIDRKRSGDHLAITGNYTGGEYTMHRNRTSPSHGGMMLLYTNDSSSNKLPSVAGNYSYYKYGFNRVSGTKSGAMCQSDYTTIVIGDLKVPDSLIGITHNDRCDVLYYSFGCPLMKLNSSSDVVKSDNYGYLYNSKTGMAEVTLFYGDTFINIFNYTSTYLTRYEDAANSGLGTVSEKNNIQGNDSGGPSICEILYDEDHHTKAFQGINGSQCTMFSEESISIQAQSYIPIESQYNLYLTTGKRPELDFDGSQLSSSSFNKIEYKTDWSVDTIAKEGVISPDAFPNYNNPGNNTEANKTSIPVWSNKSYFTKTTSSDAINKVPLWYDSTYYHADSSLSYVYRTYNSGYISKLFQDAAKGLYTVEASYTTSSGTYDCRFRFSATKSFNETDDSYLIFRDGDTSGNWDVDSRYGPITGLYKFNNELYFWQDSAFARIQVHDRQPITDSETASAAVTIGVGGVLKDPIYLSTTNGISSSVKNADYDFINKYNKDVDQMNWDTGEFGDSLDGMPYDKRKLTSTTYASDCYVASDKYLYWYDHNNADLIIFNGQTQSLSKAKGIQSFLNKYKDDFNSKLCFSYDKKHNEVLFTFLPKIGLYYSSNDTNEPPHTIAYNENVGAVTSFYNTGQIFTLNMPDGLYSFDMCSNLRKHGTSENNERSLVRISVNTSPIYNKVFDKVEFTSEFSRKGINFTKIYFETPSMKSNNVDFISHREDTYRFAVPRCKTDGYVEFANRIKGKYMIGTYEFSNPGESFKLHSIITTFRQSFI